MTQVYIVRNQHHHYLDRHGQWVDGAEHQGLYRTPYKDEAINTKVELSVRHPDLRLSLVDAMLNDKGQLQLASHNDLPAKVQAIDSNETPLFSADREESAATLTADTAFD